MLVRHLATTGTLEPLRGLTGLTVLSVPTNNLVGMCTQAHNTRNDCDGECECVCTEAQYMLVVVLYLDGLRIMYCVCWCVGVDRVGGLEYLARRRAIAGTLDPVRGLFRLTNLSLANNSIGGTSVGTAVASCRCCNGEYVREGVPVAIHLFDASNRII